MVGINLNISKTENQLQIIDWIKEPNSFFMSLIIFLSITLIGPISEEILYRHLLIREVGKILPYKVMAIISILLFAVIHILSAKSLLEILTYLVLAVPIVLSYLKSNFNVFVSISLHVFINITSYIYIIDIFLVKKEEFFDKTFRVFIKYMFYVTGIEICHIFY